jgi:glycosyltransferase involved in cell wall biosynthesis
MNIGYISRMCESNGLGVLVDAFIKMKEDHQWDAVKLIITGGSTGADDKFINKIKSKIRKAGLEGSVDFHKDFEEEGRHDFFRKVSLVSVPVLDGEAFGLYLIESMASGVPVVQPALGAFPEIIEKSGGGVIYQPNTPDQLAIALSELLSDRAKLSQLRKNGLEGVNEKFNIHKQAIEIIDFYKKIINPDEFDSDAA